MPQLRLQPYYKHIRVLKPLRPLQRWNSLPVKRERRSPMEVDELSPPQPKAGPSKHLKCDACGLRFSRSYELVRHLETARVHTKDQLVEEKFACDCGKAFSRRDACVRHQRQCDRGGNGLFIVRTSARGAARQEPRGRRPASPTPVPRKEEGVGVSCQAASADSRPRPSRYDPVRDCEGWHWDAGALSALSGSPVARPQTQRKASPKPMAIDDIFDGLIRIKSEEEWD